MDELKMKLQELKSKITSALDEAEALLAKDDLAGAKAKQAEAKTLREKAEVVKVQIEAKETDRLAALEAEVKTLKAQAQEPLRLPFSAPEGEGATPTDGVKAFLNLRYGEPEAALKAVLHDLYGADYAQRRLDQMQAFVKYVRLGSNFLSAKEHEILSPSARNILLRPEALAEEIKAGRMVSEIKATLEEGSGELGGFLVPEDYRTEIIKRLQGQVVVRARARVVTTTRDAVEWPRLEQNDSTARYTSAVRVTWVDETPTSATAASTNPTWGLIRVPINTVMARTDLSRNLLEDSAFNLLDVMADLFAEAMAVDEDEQFLVGTGGGRPKGVLGERVTGADEGPVTGVGVAVTTDASQLTDNGLMDLIYLLPSQYRGNAVLVMARNTHRDIRKIKDGEGRFVWQPGLAAGQPPTVLGYPTFESQAMPAVAANKHPIIFGDFTGYIIADRVGMSVERVTDTTTTGQNTVALFARRRLGGQVISPWSFTVQKVSAT